MPLNVLICGGGCAGPALAFWLSRLGHNITIVERHSALRDTGAQIDLRAQGIQVARRMGLLSTIKEYVADEDGLYILNTEGNVCATVMANKTGKGPQSFTSEYEIMRGDLVRILYNATDNENVKYVFGKSVESFEDDGEGVTVQFSDGSSGRFDMLVGADGQGSRIRRAILPPGEDPSTHLGVHLAYWTVPRIDSDDKMSRSFNAPGGRVVMQRTPNPRVAQIYLVLRDDDGAASKLQSMHKVTAEEQKEFWAQRFGDIGWRMPRFLAGLKDTDNFYCSELVQIKTKTWHKGRVVLLGDAAHCASPASGMGTTGGLVGAYVLAGEIARNAGNVEEAFAGYDKVMRPFAEEMQSGHPHFVKYILPISTWGIKVLHAIFWLVCFLRIPDLATRFLPEEKGNWRLPDYPELEK